MKKYLIFLVLITFLVTNVVAVKISIAVESIEDRTELLNRQIEEFENQNPNISVETFLIPSYPGSTYKFYGTFVVTNKKEPTIFILDFSWIEEYSPFLLTIEDGYDYFEMNKFLPPVIEAVKVNEEIKAIPYYLEPGLLYYRKDLLDKYGYKPPKSWNELYEIAQYISTMEGIYGFVWEGARYEGLTTFFLEVLYSFGGKIFEEDKFVLNSQENKNKAIEALELMKSFIDDELSPKGVTTYREEECRNIFQNGEAVFMRNLSYAWHLVNSPDSNIKGKVGFVPLPKTDYVENNVSVLEGKALAINPNATKEEIEAAKSFIKFLLNSNNQAQLFAFLNFMPVKREIFDNSLISQTDSNLLKFEPILENLELKPKSSIYTEISFVIQNNVYDALTGRVSVEKAVTDMINQIEFLIQ